jgi:hypothetical protein
MQQTQNGGNFDVKNSAIRVRVCDVRLRARARVYVRVCIPARRVYACACRDVRAIHVCAVSVSFKGDSLRKVQKGYIFVVLF